MILQEEFQKHGYRDLLTEDTASKYSIDLNDIFDQEQKPEELMSIYISEQRDELFFLLNGDIKEINSLCDAWDDRIRVFIILNGQSEAIHALKFNIVQLVVSSRDALDKDKEGNLLISRKIILKGDLSNKDEIKIDDEECIGLPFHMVTADSFKPDEERTKLLRCLLPEDPELLAIMEKKQRKVNRKEKNGILQKSFEEQDYEKIREWLGQ